MRAPVYRVYFAAAVAATALTLAACTSASHPAASSAAPTEPPATSVTASLPTAPAVAAITPAPTVHHSVVPTPAPATRATHTVPRTPTPTPTPTPTSTHRVATAAATLPLGLSTGNATRVITVVAASTSSTVASLQAWQKAGSGWSRYGSAVTAHVGSAGLTTHPSESLSATPIGSFTLTQAFGAYSNPGTSLPYRQTNLSDWWISQPSPLYNSFQSCSAHCSFDTSASASNPNEHLVTETPFYDYAVVIDYNTVNAGPVRPGAGSAFFLHVTDGNPTAGCVSIPMSTLVTIMRWLTPAAHPRILIGPG